MPQLRLQLAYWVGIATACSVYSVPSRDDTEGNAGGNAGAIGGGGSKAFSAGASSAAGSPMIGGSAGMMASGAGVGSAGGDGVAGGSGSQAAGEGGQAGQSAAGSETLLGYYRFDSQSGTQATDSSGRGHHGALAANSQAALPNWAAGNPGSALEVSGTNFVSVPYAPDWNEINERNAFTIAAFSHRLKHGVGWNMFVSRQYKLTPREHFGLGFYDDKAAGLVDTATDANRYCTASEASPLDSWVHLAATYDGATLNVYENGIKVCGRDAPGPVTNDDAISGIVVGGNSNDSAASAEDTFVGRIDELAIYSRVLSQGELVRLAAGTPATDL